MSFALDVSKFADSASVRVDRIRRSVALKLFGAVIADTPVLSGRLRGNWQCTVAAPAIGEIPARGAGVPAGSVPPEQMQEIEAATAAVKGSDRALYLRNNLPYAGRIEFDGYSHEKAPQGMVRKNVARITRLASEAIREGKL